METPRIVSLLPSATEMLFALGLGTRIVGRSHECDFPEEVSALASCSLDKLKAAPGDSAAIHQDIEHLLAQALAVYEVDVMRLKELKPTHIVTQHQCSVCAVSMSDVEKALASWLGDAPMVLSLAPKTLQHIFDDILRVGLAFDAIFPAEDLVIKCMRRINHIKALAQDIRQKPTVACIEWTDPLMVAGYWVPELVKNAGGRAVLATAGQHSPPVAWEALLEADPDYIIAMPCGFNVEQTRQAVTQLQAHPLWSQLRAVREKRVFLTDGHQYFSRPGPRMVDSLEILSEILHPEQFHFEHEGQGWQRFFNS